MLDYDFFKNSRIAADMTFRLTATDLGDCRDWEHFRARALDARRTFGGEFNDGFMANVKALFSTGTAGERALIVGILHAIDYDEVAEQLCGEIKTSPLGLMAFVDLEMRTLVACCIALLGPMPSLHLQSVGN